VHGPVKPSALTVATQSPVRAYRFDAITPRARLWARLLWSVGIGAVIWGSLPSGPKLQAWETSIPFPGWNDKPLHFPGYLGLAFPAVPGFPRRGIRVALSMILLGVLLEFAQLSVAGRTADLKDALADAAGVLAGIAAALISRIPALPGRNAGETFKDPKH